MRVIYLVEKIYRFIVPFLWNFKLQSVWTIRLSTICKLEDQIHSCKIVASRNNLDTNQINSKTDKPQENHKTIYLM